MDEQKRINDFLVKALCNYDLPGLAVGVQVGERNKSGLSGFNYDGAVGYFDMPDRKPLMADHVFHMASVTKLFVGTSIMQLVEKGKVDIAKPMLKYLPWFEGKDQGYKDVTVADLLSHTGGVGDVEDYGWNRPHVDSTAIKRYLESEEVRVLPLLWSPSENKFQYSNIGYEMLGQIIAECSGQNFDDYVAKNILKPLGMNDSTTLTFARTDAGKQLNTEAATDDEIKAALDLKALNRAGVCTPHEKDKDNFIVRAANFPYNREHGPSSTLTSNLADIKKFGRAHLNKELLSLKTYETVWTPVALVPNNGENMGRSWFIREQNGETFYGHEGTDDGFRSSFWICPEQDLQIVVLSNISRAPVKKINKQIFEILLEK